MPIKSKVLIQIVQKSQNRHKISFAIEFNNKNTKKVFGPDLPPSPNTIKLDLPPDIIRVNISTMVLHISDVYIQYGILT